MSELRTLHPYLYKRVQLKGIVFSLIGLSQMFAPYIDRLLHTERDTNGSGIPALWSGLIFFIIGAAILGFLYSSPQGYKKSRKAMWVAFFYALFWEFVLLALVITQSITTLAIFILWGYLTYNLFLIARDSAWEGAEIVREVRKEDNGTA